MPKKTKAQKIIAELRRKLATQEARKATLLRVSKNERREFTKERHAQKPSLTLTQPQPKSKEVFSSFVISDLKKSLFLTALAISLEFVLYYLLELGGVKKFSLIIGLIGKRVGEKP